MVIGVTSLNQIRDMNGYVTNLLNGVPFSVMNQYFTLTQGTVKSVTVPNSGAFSYVAVFTYTLGADVWVQPLASPSLTAPDGTVTTTTAQLNPGIRIVTPGEVLQILYENVTSSGAVVSVGIAYYSLAADNFMG